MSLILLLACATHLDCPDWFSDLDGDGFGAGEGVVSCEPLPGRREVDGDRDDHEASIHPDATDLHDGFDQNCDGLEGCEGALVVQSIEEVDCWLSTLSVGGEIISRCP